MCSKYYCLAQLAGIATRITGVVDWGSGVFASCCCGSKCSLVRAMDGCIAAAPLALAN